MNKTFLYAMAFIVITITSCASDDETMQTTKRRPLTISVVELPMSVDGEDNNTRTAVITTSSLNSFVMDYQYNGTNHGNMTATLDVNGKWGCDNYWPDIDDVVYWYAHTDGTFQNESTPYLSYTVDENSSFQKDLLVATNYGTYSDKNGKLSFTFDHACTAVRIYMKKAKNISDYTLQVSEVQLCNIKKSGNYMLGSKSWSSVTTDANFTLYSGSVKTLGSDSYEALDDSDSPYIFLIPQSLTAWNVSSNTGGAYVKISCVITNVSNTVYSGVAYIPLATTLMQGYCHDVKINIGKNSLLASDGTKIIQ